MGNGIYFVPSFPANTDEGKNVGFHAEDAVFGAGHARPRTDEASDVTAASAKGAETRRDLARLKKKRKIEM